MSFTARARAFSMFFGETMPVSWLVSLDAIISTLTVGGALVFWSVWAKYWKEPDEIVKLAIGALIAAGAPLLLAAASEEGADADSAASTAARQAATKAPPRVVAIHKGEGQVAGPGFASPEWVSGRLLALADGGLSFVWGEGLGMVTEMRRLRLP